MGYRVWGRQGAVSSRGGKAAFPWSVGLSFSWSLTRRIKSTPSNPISLRFISISSSRPRLVIPSGFVPSSLPSKTVYACPFFHTRATCPDKKILPIFDLLFLCCYFPFCYISETSVTNQRIEHFVLDHEFPNPGSPRKRRLLETSEGSWTTKIIKANLMAYIGR